MTGVPIRPAWALALLVTGALAASGCVQTDDPGTLRLGYFPNLTHAQALYGLQTGLFAKALGPEVKVQATKFFDGPTAIGALLTGRVDATYVGPSPTLNALAVAGPGVVVIVAGAASGGARFIVQPDLVLKADGDFAGKTFASPQLGNTQDISLKHYLQSRGQSTTDKGGSVQVINAANPDILALFTRGQVDGAWVPEPWATRLERDGHGVQFLDERSLWPDGQFVTTQLVTTQTYLDRHPGTVRRLLDAHVAATAAVRDGGADVLATINDGIQAATGQRLGDDLLAAAFAKLTFTDDPLAASFLKDAQDARDLGIPSGAIPPVVAMYRLDLLNAARAARGLSAIGTP